MTNYNSERVPRIPGYFSLNLLLPVSRKTCFSFFSVLLLIAPLFPQFLFSQGTWTQKASIPTTNYRLSNFGFAINGKGYTGTGWDAVNVYSDFWEYDPVSNAWTQKANFGGGSMYFGVGVAIGSKGYAGMGLNATGANLPGWWEYDPVANSWTAKAGMPGPARARACAFAVGTKGYLASGALPSGNSLQDIYEYDPAANSWTSKANFPLAIGRQDIDRVPFVLNNKAYLGLGAGPNNVTCFNDWWEYDPAANSWTQKANFPGAPRMGASGFAICNKGYAGLGADNSTGYSDWYQYDPVANSWSPVASFPPGARADAPTFVIGNSGYVVDGYTIASQLWEFTIGGNLAVSASPATICSGQSTTITASGGTNYQWSTGATTTSIVVSPVGTTTFSVSDNGSACGGLTTVTITVAPPPTAAISAGTTICSGQPATLSASGGSQYSWSNGSTTSVISVSPTATATYSVIVSNGPSCSDTASATITVIPGPSVSVSGNTSLCQGDIATLTASGGAGYSWSTGATTSLITTAPSVTTSYTVSSGSAPCVSSATITVIVSPPPVAAVNNTSICSGQTATLTASGGGSYLWSNGSTANPLLISPTASTTYSVIVSIGSCSDTAAAVVNVVPGVTAAISGNTVLCAGDIATLTASGGGNYSWSNGSTSNVITVAPSATATYTVVTSSGNGCTAFATSTVTVLPPPVATAAGTTICLGETATLTAGGGGNYSWSNGSTANPLLVSPSANTTYTVIVNIGSCADTASAVVVVTPAPFASAFSNVTIKPGESTTLTASGGGTYLWSNGATDSVITVTPAITTVYCVTVTVPPGVCKDTSCVTVTVELKDCGFADDQLFVPDAFSPNDDGKNDHLGIYYPDVSCIKELLFIVYDRWGEKVFEGNTMVAAWDGRYKGQLMNTAVFVYYMKVTFLSGSETVRKGNVSLIR